MTAQTEGKTSPTDAEFLALATDHPDPGRLDDLAENLPALRDCYSRHPKSYALGGLVGLVQQRAIGKAYGLTAEEMNAVRAKRTAARAESVERPFLDGGAFWALVEKRHPDGCPSCNGQIGGYAVREDEWRWRCGWRTCRHSEDILSLDF